jgi:hypothetical protein
MQSDTEKEINLALNQKFIYKLLKIFPTLLLTYFFAKNQPCRNKLRFMKSFRYLICGLSKSLLRTEFLDRKKGRNIKRNLLNYYKSFFILRKSSR